jgi:hypothetical protein
VGSSGCIVLLCGMCFCTGSRLLLFYKLSWITKLQQSQTTTSHATFTSDENEMGEGLNIRHEGVIFITDGENTTLDAEFAALTSLLL